MDGHLLQQPLPYLELNDSFGDCIFLEIINKKDSAIPIGQFVVAIQNF